MEGSVSFDYVVDSTKWEKAWFVVAWSWRLLMALRLMILLLTIDAITQVI